MEAEQMQRDEQLRRRNAMILERKEKENRPFPHASAHKLSSADVDSSMASTQPVCRHGPVTAPGDMLPPPSTAPTADAGDGSIICAPPTANPIQPAIANIHLPRTEPLPFYDSAKEDNDTPVASERTGPRTPIRSEVNGHNAEVNEDMSHNKENKGARKHGLAADEERVSKKAKRAPVTGLSFSHSKATKKLFADLLDREAARSSERGL